MTDSYWCAKCGIPHTLGQRCPASMRAKWRRQDAQRAPHHGWYSSPTWRALRAQVLAAQPWCVGCMAEGRHTPATEVDHIVPHRGDWFTFTDIDNLQPLCKSCHSRKTMAEMQGDTMRKSRAFSPKTARRPVYARRPVAPAAAGPEVW
ncbi:MAG: hypothetical protein KatS3mg005_2054 [Bryobacteraceae bacterium]|nr:MAG: hypothetical protein KatS3mg005_2054 [Bryobacteraceae bacterium]